MDFRRMISGFHQELVSVCIVKPFNNGYKNRGKLQIRETPWQ